MRVISAIHPSLDFFCRKLIQEAPDAIIYADVGGMIRFWNRGAERIFGHTSDEAVGASLDLIIPKFLRERHWTGYKAVMMTGVTQYDTKVLAVPAQRKDGSRISIEFTVALIRDRGRLLGAAALIRDVTERWERERAQRKDLARLKELAAVSASK